MYIVIYVQDNRTFPKLFQHSYVTLSDPGTAQLINMAYFIHFCPPPDPELKCIRITATESGIKQLFQFKVHTDM